MKRNCRFSTSERAALLGGCSLGARTQEPERHVVLRLSMEKGRFSEHTAYRELIISCPHVQFQLQCLITTVWWCSIASSFAFFHEHLCLTKVRLYFWWPNKNPRGMRVSFHHLVLWRLEKFVITFARPTVCWWATWRDQRTLWNNIQIVAWKCYQVTTWKNPERVNS